MYIRTKFHLFLSREITDAQYEVLGEKSKRYYTKKYEPKLFNSPPSYRSSTYDNTDIEPLPSYLSAGLDNSLLGGYQSEPINSPTHDFNGFGGGDGGGAGAGGSWDNSPSSNDYNSNGSYSSSSYDSGSSSYDSSSSDSSSSSSSFD